MSKIIAYCGLECSKCPAYVATQNNDENKLKEVAKEWSNENMQFEPKDILCDGCFSDNKIFQWCKACDIRKCARQKGLESCAYCNDYPCNFLNNVFNNDPSAKERLDNFKKAI